MMNLKQREKKMTYMVPGRSASGQQALAAGGVLVMRYGNESIMRPSWRFLHPGRGRKLEAPRGQVHLRRLPYFNLITLSSDQFGLCARGGQRKVTKRERGQGGGLKL